MIDTTDTQYSLTQVCETLHVKVQRVREWMNHGYITPHSPSRGQGLKNLFHLEDIFSIELFKTLIDNGCSRAKAKEVIASLGRIDKPTGLFICQWTDLAGRRKIQVSSLPMSRLVDVGMWTDLTLINPSFIREKIKASLKENARYSLEIMEAA